MKGFVPGGRWNQERLIIFTEYRDTQKWLHDHLETRGFKEGDRLELLYGAQDPKDRERIKAAFQFDPKDSPVRILLATDAASEGIDLQRHCHRLIQYEIPMESESAGATQRPHRPTWPARGRGKGLPFRGAGFARRPTSPLVPPVRFPRIWNFCIGRQRRSNRFAKTWARSVQ